MDGSPKLALFFPADITEEEQKKLQRFCAEGNKEAGRRARAGEVVCFFRPFGRDSSWEIPNARRALSLLGHRAIWRLVKVADPELSLGDTDEGLTADEVEQMLVEAESRESARPVPPRYRLYARIVEAALDVDWSAPDATDRILDAAGVTCPVQRHGGFEMFDPGHELMGHFRRDDSGLVSEVTIAESKPRNPEHLVKALSTIDDLSLVGEDPDAEDGESSIYESDGKLVTVNTGAHSTRVTVTAKGT